MKIVGDDPDIEGVMGQMEGANGSAGTNNSRLMMIKLKPLTIRKSTPEQIIRRLRPKVSRIPGVNVFLTNPPAIRLWRRKICR
jgi:HAE1 family hydrophobic/amphiphilic exporter-1